MADSGKKGRLLIADDDPEILSMLTKRFVRAGYEVLEAADGDQALETARKEKPHLILLDVMMPGKNGWEVARELRHDEQTRDIGILMLTAIGEKMNEMTSPLYGADDFVDKPFDFTELEARVQAVLARRKK